MKNLLICNCCGDEQRAPISMYLLAQKTKQVMAGVARIAEEKEADIMYFLPRGSKMILPGAEVKYGTESLVTCNAFAILQELEGNLPRPTIQDDLIPEYGGKTILLTTPEEAYKTASGAECKFVYVIRGGKSEVKEAVCGTKLSEIADMSNAKAVLLGGIRGTFLLPEELEQYEVTAEHLYDSVTVYEKSDCMAAVMAKLTEEAWQASCGKCVLCREGTLQFKTIVSEMTQGKAHPADPELLKDIGALIGAGAYCAFGKSMPRPLLSALNLFAEEFDAHIRKKACPAGVCYQSEAAYVILPDACTGCMDCLDECDEDAIVGKKGFIHMIDQDMCEGCGKCVAACEEGAIVKVTGKLPKLPKKLMKVGRF